MIEQAFDAPTCAKCKKRPCAMVSTTHEHGKTYISFADECIICYTSIPFRGKG
jgi:hypothetical protein